MQAMDGNTAAVHVAYAMSETAFIYPISPATSMGETMDKWSSEGRQNIFGQRCEVTVMQSEGGAAGAVHGSLVAGGLSSTFTAAQGLLLMVPNLYLIAGELSPTVFHVSARTVAKHALSIFNDHSDVMACRQTGFAMLCSNNVQEVMDMSLVAHLTTLKARVPFMHFFDGYRVSAQINKVNVIPYEVIQQLADQDAIQRNLREVALNPNHPIIRATGQRPDIFFQNSVAAHKYFLAAPGLVQETMNEVAAITGRQYHLFDYHGAPDAERVAVIMGSAASTVRECVDYLNAKGEKVGVLKVRLYRPWDAEAFKAAMPETARDIVVLDRTREDGAFGSPLFLDVAATFQVARDVRNIVGGQYGLASKEFTPKHALAAFENLKQDKPMHNFVVGINDDVTHTSLPIGDEIDTLPAGTKQCLFWGLGTDGTVGANKAAIKTIGDNTPLFTQGHFAYDSHKGGGVTMSHLRFGPDPNLPEYEIQEGCDYIACGNTSYVRKFDMIKTARPGATFVLNTEWDTLEELEANLPDKMKRTIASKGLNFYTINATKVAREIGLGQRINTVMQAVFYHLSGVLPQEEAVQLLKDDIVKLYSKKGPKVVDMNHRAVDAAAESLQFVPVPASWIHAKNDTLPYGAGVPVPHVPKADTGLQLPQMPQKNNPNLSNNAVDPVGFVEAVMDPVLALEGDNLPVSAFTPGGHMPSGTTQFEKRGIAPEVPVWIPDKCTQCNYCAIVCPHAVIRPFLFDRDAMDAKPADFPHRRAQGGAELAGKQYSITVSTMDCTGCAVCVQSCPDDSLFMGEYNTYAEQGAPWWEFAMSKSVKENPTDKFTVKGSQFETPLLEFSGACAGCGETPYVKLLTQLFGKRLMIANASGCSSVWGGTSTTNPYTTNPVDGRGPAWGRSLFEDNAEFGLGMALASVQRRAQVKDKVRAALDGGADLSPELTKAFSSWLQEFDNAEAADQYYATICPLLEKERGGQPLLESIHNGRDMLTKHSQWIIGGDGWAYDIGFGGLDHVLAKGSNVNIMVLDTEMYSNTGGQVSKSTPQSALVKFATAGKEQNKKDLGGHAINYGGVYVASMAMGADYNQSVQAIREAESYNGPSLLLCYSPCIDWGVDMKDMMQVQKLAVDSGYWPLYRYDPRRAEQGGIPFQLDSKRIKADLADYLKSENRYAALARTDSERATRLQGAFKDYTVGRMEHMQRQAMDESELLDHLKEKIGESTGEKMLILYASETGITASLSKHLEREMRRRDIRVKVSTYDDFDIADLPKQSVVINLAATCGQGEFPANSKMFWDQISDESLASDYLKGVKYATFAMGDTGYVFFNEVGKLIDSRFKELGGTEVLPIGMGDDQAEDKWETAYNEWEPELWNELGTAPPPKELLPAAFHVNKLDASANVSLPPFITPHDAVGPGVLVPLESCRPLTPGGRDLRQYEFNIEGTGLTYDAGDALAIFSTNGEDRVAQFLDWYGVSPDTKLQLLDVGRSGLKVPEHVTAHQLFTQHLDIFGRPKRNFYEMLSLLAEKPEERERLEFLISKEGKSDMRALVKDTVTHADVMKMFPSARVPIEYLLDYVPSIKPRLYSIGSASEMYPNHIHLGIVEEDWKNSHGEMRRGQSTWFLRNQTPGMKWGHTMQLKNDAEAPFANVENPPLMPVRVNPAVVHLPEDPKTPLVMVGLGTGFVPFRSFIQQRVVLKSRGIETGDMVLYFGARFKATEFLYGDEIEAYEADGTITHLRCAFSRDQAEKVYAQHLIDREPELLYDYMMNRGASFYLCGPAGNMPAQMKESVINAIAKVGKMEHSEAVKLVTQWQIEGRYNVEVWG